MKKEKKVENYINIGEYHITQDKIGNIKVFGDEGFLIAQFALHDDFVNWLYTKYQKE